MRYKLNNIADCRAVVRRVWREYMVQSDEDDDRTLAIKRVLRTLPTDEQVLFILHTEIESYRTLAKIFGVSRTTILNRINEIKTKIRQRVKC